MTRLFAALIVPDGDGWLGTVPDLPGLEFRARTALDVEIGLPAAIAAALPARMPRPCARLLWVRPAGQRAPLRPPIRPEAASEARRAIRGLLGGPAPLPADLAHRLLAWDQDLAELEARTEPTLRTTTGIGISLDGGIVVAREPDGRELALFVLEEDEAYPSTSAQRPA